MLISTPIGSIEVEPPAVIAIGKTGKNRAIGINSDKTSPKFWREYPDGNKRYTRHAEMHLFQKNAYWKEIWVLRVLANGKLSMAKPCPACQRFLNTKKIWYTNWEGKWELWRWKEKQP